MFKTTTIYENRIRDRKELFAEIPLTEEGNSETNFYSKRSGILLCKGYERIVFGDHGPYIEFELEQVKFDFWACDRQGIGYFNKFYPRDGSGIMMYAQRMSVNKLPNPPKGKFSFRGNRKEGYADYRVGMYYISPWLKHLKIIKNGIVLNNQKCNLSDLFGGW
jgi:hypothetical protein